MKKILLVTMVPYLLVMALAFYVFFGPGIMASYQNLDWKKLQTQVPGDFEVKTYKDNEWEVYSLYKLFVHVKIAVRPAIDLSGYPSQKKKVKFTYSSGKTNIYYLTSSRKLFDVIYAENVEDKTIYFRASAGSVYAAVYIMKKLTTNAYYNGIKLSAPQPEIPLRHFITDIVFAVGMSLPLFLIVFMLVLSGMKPAAKHFSGDPIRLQESNVYCNIKKKIGRKITLCYLALTSTRLMVFVFKKPVVVIHLNQDKSGLRFEGDKIIFQKGEEIYQVKPSELERWKRQISAF